MRALPTTGLAVLAAAALLAVAPAAGAATSPARADHGRELAAASRVAARAAGPSNTLIQRALDGCRQRGYPDGSQQLRRCAERRLGLSEGALAGAAPTDPGQGGGGEGGSQPNPGSTQPPPAATSPAPPAVTTPPPPSPQPPAARGPVVSDQGIVQAATPDGIVLRSLDGASVAIPYDRRTAFYLGDRNGSRNDVQPGAVVVVRHFDPGPALDVRVVPPPRPRFRTDRAITDSVTPTVIVVRLRDGTPLSIAVTGATRVSLPNGRQGGPELLQPGLLVDIVYDPAGTVPAQSVKIIRRV